MAKLDEIPRPRPAGRTPRPATITLDVTPEMLATLEGLASDSGQPLDAVFTKAIALYRAALDATRDGKHVGVAAQSDALDVEFTGLASSGT